MTTRTAVAWILTLFLMVPAHAGETEPSIDAQLSRVLELVLGIQSLNGEAGEIVRALAFQANSAGFFEIDRPFVMRKSIEALKCELELILEEEDELSEGDVDAIEEALDVLCSVLQDATTREPLALQDDVLRRPLLDPPPNGCAIGILVRASDYSRYGFRGVDLNAEPGEDIPLTANVGPEGGTIDWDFGVGAPHAISRVRGSSAGVQYRIRGKFRVRATYLAPNGASCSDELNISVGQLR